MPPLSDAALLTRVGEMFDAVDPVPDGLAERCQALLGMRALTIRWPHVAAIVYPAPDGCLPKRTENRSRATSYRGPVAIHAGKAWDPRSTVSGTQRFWENSGGLSGIDFDQAQGSILAVADLVDCHRSVGCCSPWGESSPNVFHWVLDDVRPLPEPVPCRGQLGLWRPDTDTLGAVLRQLAEVAR